MNAALFRETITTHYGERGLVVPEVELVPIKKPKIWTDIEGRPFSIHSSHKWIGECVINEREINGRSERFFAGVSVMPKFAKGFGVATYQEVISCALEDGVDFRTDIESLNDNSIRMWRRLISLGLATEISPAVTAVGDVDTGIQWHVVVEAGSY